MSTVAQRVTRVIADHFPSVENVTAEMTFADMNGDSLDHIEIIIALEDEFSIQIDDDTVDGITSVQQAIDYVTSKVSA